jgi:L,D-transpeptidase ErfK/SrfK
MLDSPFSEMRSLPPCPLKCPLSLQVSLAGLWLPATLWATAVHASPPLHPVELHDLGPTATAISVVTTPTVIHDSSLFLPIASQRISRLVLRLSERQLYGYRGDLEVARYPVAIGRDDWATPMGEFRVFQRQVHPAWEHPFTGAIIPPGPDNPLGARWLGFWTDGTNAIGFHGTPHEHLIGEAVSHGCVRLRNADVIELYDRVNLGTPVTVLP